MERKKMMSEEAFNELIDNLEIVEKLTLYGRRSIKYHVKKLQDELKGLEDVKEIMNTNVKELVDLKNIKKIKDENWRLQTDNKIKKDEIDKKDKQIQELINKNKKLELEAQENFDKATENAEEIIKLNKIINKMAKYIVKEDKTEKFCDYKTVCDNDCEECVEAYFREESE